MKAKIFDEICENGAVTFYEHIPGMEEEVWRIQPVKDEEMHLNDDYAQIVIIGEKQDVLPIFKKLSNQLGRDWHDKRYKIKNDHSFLMNYFKKHYCASEDIVMVTMSPGDSSWGRHTWEVGLYGPHQAARKLFEIVEGVGGVINEIIKERPEPELPAKQKEGIKAEISLIRGL